MVNDSTIFNDIAVGNNWCTEQICCPLRQDNGSDFTYGEGLNSSGTLTFAFSYIA